jgi:hypothetical protein
VNTGRNQTISTDFISSAAAAARQVRMAGAGGGAPAGDAPQPEEPLQAYPEAPQGGAEPKPVPKPSEPKSLPNSALSGIVGKLKAMKGAGLDAPAPGAAQPVEPQPAEEPSAEVEPAPGAHEAPAEPVREEAPSAEEAPESPSEAPAEEAPSTAPVDFKSLAKQSVTQLVSGLESEDENAES